MGGQVEEGMGGEITKVRGLQENYKKVSYLEDS